MNINFAFEALQKLAIFSYGRFEFKAVGNKWLHETNKEEEECKETSSDQTTTIQESASASVKAADTVHCFWRKCSVVFDPE